MPDYSSMPYRRVGRSGLVLPAISLGLWHNFGSVDVYDNARALARRAFDIGITHFDLANNYGPEPGSAEETFGRILKQDLAGHRDELIVSTKAGYRMGPGPYGDGGSRKYLLSSLDASLKRMGLEYVDVFYHHRPDHETPLEESMLALDHAVRQGKALYVGLSNYDVERTHQASVILRELRTPFIVHQPIYSMFNRWAETSGLLHMLEREELGSIVFSPLAQGMLTNKYLHGIPDDSRAARPTGFLRPDAITDHRRWQINELHQMATNRGQSLAQLALAWVLRLPVVTSALIGASRVEQIDDCVGALKNLHFSQDEFQAIERIIA